MDQRQFIQLCPGLLALHTEIEMDRLQISAITATTIVVSSVFASIFSWSLDLGVVPYIGVTAIAMGILIGWFEKDLWKLRFLHPRLVDRPVIDGNWKGTISSLWENPETGKRIDDIDAQVTIQQTLSKIYIRLQTKSSSGNLIDGTIRNEHDGAKLLVATYFNEPEIETKATNPSHKGTMILRIEPGDNFPSDLVGTYWTDRKTEGRIVLKRMEKPPVA